MPGNLLPTSLPGTQRVEVQLSLISGITVGRAMWGWGLEEMTTNFKIS